MVHISEDILVHIQKGTNNDKPQLCLHRQNYYGTRWDKMVHWFKDILVHIQKGILYAFIDYVVIIKSQIGTLMIDVLVH